MISDPTTILGNLNGEKNYLVILKPENLQQNIDSLINFLVNKRQWNCIYLSLNKPYLALKKSLEQKNYNLKKFFFIDAVGGSETEGIDNVIFIPSSSTLTTIDISITQLSQFTQSHGFVLIDTLEGLLINNESNVLANFIKSVVRKSSKYNSKTIVLSSGGGEPQTSFSKETQPLQNVSQSVSLNIPSTHAAGSFIVRASTEYLNSDQPNSAASDSVTLTTTTPTEIPATTSGGGGGGGRVINKTSPITGETITPPEYLIDISTRILEEYKKVNPGKKVLMELTLYNLGTEEIKDATINYCIKNSNEEIIKCSKETAIIYTKIQLVKEFFIPRNIEEGRYYIVTEVTYNKEKNKISSETSFEVTESTFDTQKDFIKSYLLPLGLGILILMILIILILVYENRKKPKKIPKYPKAKQPRIIKNKKNMRTSRNIFSRLREFIENSYKKHPKNSVRGLINRKVYSEDGDYIGKVKEVTLKNNGLEDLKIKLSKKYKFKAKGIIVNYRHVKSTNEIVIVDKHVLRTINEKLSSFNNQNL